MPGKTHFSVTAKKIISASGNTLYEGSGRVVTIHDTFIAYPDNNSTDTLIVTGSGVQITAQEDLSDFNTAISATQITGS
jgi:hypothetical protein